MVTLSLCSHVGVDVCVCGGDGGVGCVGGGCVCVLYFLYLIGFIIS